MFAQRALIRAACIAAVACLLGAGSAFGLIYTYENTTSGATGFVSSNANCDSGTGAFNIPFSVSDAFTVATIAVGLNVTHTERGDYRIRLIAPGGAAFDLVTQGADTSDNYDVLFSANNEGPVDDGDLDPVTEPYYARLAFVTGIDFYTGSAQGDWTLRLCDRDNNAVNGTFNRARLILSDTASAPQVCTSTVTYEWGDNGDGNGFTSTTAGGVTLALVSTEDLTTDGFSDADYVNFTTDTSVFGNEAGWYVMRFDAEAADQEAVLLRTRWSFSPAVRDLVVTMLDVDSGTDGGGDWEDYLRLSATGPSRVPFAVTNVNATPSFQVAGDILEADGTANIADTATNGNARFSFTSALTAVEVEYMVGDDVAEPAAQRVGIGNAVFCSFDYGDAPNTYGTQLAGGARHVLGDRALYLGANRPDGESNGQPAAAATTDDTTAVDGVDDEDGVTFSSTSDGSPNSFRLIATVTGSNNTGTAAMLCGYLDGAANGTVNGTFDRSVTYTVGQVGTSNPTVGLGNEELCIRVNTSGSPTSVSLAGGSNPASATCTTGTSFSCTLTWNPNFTSTLTTYARFRLTTDAAFFSNTSPSPTGQASDGEIEDFQLNVGPTRATVDGVKLENVSAERLLAELGAGGMSAGALRQWRSEVDPDGDGRVAVLRWQTLQERGTTGFDVERRTPGGGWQRLNAEMLPGLVVSLQGGEYLWIEPGLSRGVYEYRLVEHEAWGTQLVHGPYRVRLSGSAGGGDRSLGSARESAGGLQWWPWRSLGGRFAGRGRSAPEPDEAAVAERLRTRAAREGAALRSAASSSSSGTEAQGGAAGRLVPGPEGWYRVTLAQLASVLGAPEGKLSAALASGRLELLVGGQVVPYRFEPGEDAFYFVGLPYETLETRTNAYQVRLGNGRLMEVAEGKAPEPGAVGVFRDRYVAEREVWLLPWANREETSDPWYWDYTYAPYTPEKSLAFDLPNPASSGTATLRVALRGASETGAGADHFVTLSVNGQPVPGQASWDGFGLVSLETIFDQSLLADNERVTVTVHAQAAGGASYSMVLVDDIEVSYWRRMTARDGSLWVRGADVGVVTVNGFASPDIRVIELGRSSVTERLDVTVDADGGGSWQVSFRARGGDYLVTESAREAGAETDVPSNLRSAGHRAEYLVIAPASLATGAEALAGYRSRRFTTEIVWLQDIYDEFSFGRTDSAAIESFLDYARRNWKEAPRHVVLLGRGTLDHRDLLGYGESLIPLRMAATPWGIYSSDARYADVDGDRRPEYSLGRIQAMTNEEVTAYVAKLSAYESAPGSGTVAVVADNPDDGGDFHANGDETAAAVVSYGLAAEKLYHPEDPLRARLLAGWSKGAWSAVVYDGHGSATQLGSENFLNLGDVSGLTNGAAMPIFAAWTCAAGDSTTPGVMGLADSLVLSPEGGAIAAVAPAGLSLDEPAHRLSLAFLEALLSRSQGIGQATQWAHERGVAEALAPWMLDIYLVSGDPAVGARH